MKSSLTAGTRQDDDAGELPIQRQDDDAGELPIRHRDDDAGELPIRLKDEDQVELGQDHHTGELPIPRPDDISGQLSNFRVSEAAANGASNAPVAPSRSGGSGTPTYSDIAFGSNTTLGYQQNGTSGTLSVPDGAHAANITLIGQYMASQFHLAGDGHGGTLVTDPPGTHVTDPPAAAAPSASLTAPHAYGTLLVP